MDMTVLYAATVLVSACLLFLVQPLIAKIILPWFGGTSSVWSAALVFFQVCVLGGYSYAHWLTSRVTPRLQCIVHGVLLVGSCVFMPMLPSESWRPAATSDPTLQILLLLAATVGLPSLMLSSTSPLLQVWYMRRTGSKVPYWLFALSNAGSLLALLSFPFLLEPSFTSHALAWGWSGLFLVFVALGLGVAYSSRTSMQQSETAAPPGNEPSPRVGQMLLWVLLSACASAMLVTVSAHLSANVAPIPLLWVLPLALYLLTFILAFSNRRFYNRTAFFPLLALALGCTAYLYTQSIANWPIQYVIPLYLASLFVVCMACHGELVHRQPPAQFLTRFYLLLALGGALGGAFVALAAPVMFDTYLELPLLLVVIAELFVIVQWQRRGSRRTLWLVRVAMVAGVISLVSHLLRAELNVRQENLLVQRNFYGVLSVRDDVASAELARRHLIHGTISHGYQYLNGAHRDTPASYYSTQSGVGRALLTQQDQGAVRYGAVGLGVGVLSGYARREDYLRIYEINPDVQRIAGELFTFLPAAKGKGADVAVLLGDARLTLQRQAPQNFDLLAIDAFSSDAIPTHLLTAEAFQLYFKHLQPDGVLAVHISNRYVDLAPVAARAAQSVKRSAQVVYSRSDGTFDTSVWVLITANEALLQQPRFKGADVRPARAEQTFAGWTDQYSSVWPLLKLESTDSAVAVPMKAP